MLRAGAAVGSAEAVAVRGADAPLKRLLLRDTVLLTVANACKGDAVQPACDRLGPYRDPYRR